MRLELDEGLDLFFSKNNEANYYSSSSSSCVFCTTSLLLTLKEHLQAYNDTKIAQFGCFWHSKNIYRPTMTQKLLNLVNRWEKYWKMFNDRVMFGDRWIYPYIFEFYFWICNSPWKGSSGQGKLAPAMVLAIQKRLWMTFQKPSIVLPYRPTLW
jgi:hypothetical protein